MLCQIEFLGTKMHTGRLIDVVDEIEERLRRGLFTQHVVVNVAKLVNMQSDPVLKESVEACDIVNIDGMGIVWGCRSVGLDVPERVTGIDLFDALLHRASEKNYSVYLLGAREDVLNRVVKALGGRFPRLQIAGHHHGYFWGNEEAVVEDIARSGAKMLFVAITSPAKENFINRWRERLGVTFVMGVGGTFDVVAGAVKRAPLWMQRNGLEWLYRVYQEPRRMWRRYAVTNSKFALLMLGALSKRALGRRS
jgi:N-acetylglucosaminyldiphosphoundecaprenol N-acetyl-beta-D-mannosaminyltransferase